MDRDRLKEVHQTDLTESRVNEDFVEWMKTKGPTYLLVALVAVCAILLWNRYTQGKQATWNEAWSELLSTSLPSSLEDLANEYEDQGELPNIARLQAADQWLSLVQRDRTIDSLTSTSESETPPALTEEQREQYLSHAERLYSEVAASDDGSLSRTLYVVSALNGRAAVKECRGADDEARSLYLEAADRAREFFPALAELATARAETAASSSQAVAFKTKAELAAQRPPTTPSAPAQIDGALRELLLPDESEG